MFHRWPTPANVRSPGLRPGLIELGEEVTWFAWHFGVPIRMTSRITEMTAPAFFVDEQVRGPFREFRHETRFHADGDETVFAPSRRAGRAGRSISITHSPCSSSDVVNPAPKLPVPSIAQTRLPAACESTNVRSRR